MFLWYNTLAKPRLTYLPLILCYYLSFKTRITIKWYDPFYRAIANVGQPKSCWYLKLDCVEKASNRTATICGSATYTSSSCSNSYIAVVVLLLVVVVLLPLVVGNSYYWTGIKDHLFYVRISVVARLSTMLDIFAEKYIIVDTKYLNPHSPPPPNCPLKFHPCSEVAAFVHRWCQNGQRRTWKKWSRR